MVFLISTIFIETSFTIRSSSDNLHITVIDESGNKTPYMKRRKRYEKEEEDEDTVTDTILQNVNDAGEDTTKDIKHQNIYIPAKPTIDQQVLSFRNRLFSKLGINRTATINSNQVRNRRELISDCTKIQFQQTFVVNGCSQTMQMTSCAGSCPNAGSGRSACRTTLSHNVPLRFDCPGVKTVIHMTMADYCSCTSL